MKKIVDTNRIDLIGRFLLSVGSGNAAMRIKSILKKRSVPSPMVSTLKLPTGMGSTYNMYQYPAAFPKAQLASSFLPDVQVNVYAGKVAEERKQKVVVAHDGTLSIVWVD